MKQKLLLQLLAAYKKTLNPNSKFFNEDLKNFEDGIKSNSVEDLKGRLSKLNSYADQQSTFNKTVKKEVASLNRGGMFNVSSMKPSNCLD